MSNNKSIKNSNNKMKNNTTTMQTTTSNPYGFKTINIDPQSITVHEHLVEMGYDHEIDDNFSNTAKHFSFYSKPVVDVNNKAVTNIAEIYAAKKNGLKKLEVFVCDLRGMELRRLVAFTHRYHSKSLISTYQTIQFYKEYLESGNGKKLYQQTEGKDTRAKIATLLHTSERTIGRLAQIGEHKPEKLGLIQEGETSMKAVMDEIKAERLEKQSKENAEKKKQEEQQQNTPAQPIEIPNPVIVNTPVEPIENNVPNEPVPSDTNDDPEMDQNKGKSIPFPFFVPTSEENSYKLLKGSLEIEGLGTVAFTNEGTSFSMSLNGKVIGNSECDQQIISMNGSDQQRLSIGIHPDDNRSLGLHINIDLPSSIASKRAA